MNNLTPYLTQYCNLNFEWFCKNISIDTASESQAKEMQELRIKAMEQSGLTINELALICQCRKFRISRKINDYMHKIINSL
jgi:hypothetical protein